VSQPLLAYAIAEQRWDLAALCLFVGVTKAAESLPPDAIDALLELLVAEGREHASRPAGERRRRGRCR
jgi:hypothetical protein